MSHDESTSADKPGQLESCATCGERLPDLDRYPGAFCPMCGVSIGAVRSTRPVGSVASSAEFESTIVSRGRDWSALWNRWRPPVGPKLGLVGLLLGAVLLSLMIRWALPESTSPGVQPTAESDDRPASTADADPVYEPVADVEPADDDDDDDDVVADDGSTGVVEIEAGQVVAGSGPVVGEEVGRFLFVDLSSDLVRIDLDTGEQRWFRTAANVIAATDGYLVLAQAGGLYRVGVDLPDEGGQLLYEGFDLDLQLGPFAQPAIVLGDGRLAIVETRFDRRQASSRSIIIDPVRSAADVDIMEHGPWWPRVPGLVSIPGSGTFDMLGSTPRKVFDGEVVAGGARRLLGSRCDNPTSCSLSVVDRATGDVSATDFDAVSPDGGSFHRLVGAEEKVLVTWVDSELREDSAGPVQIVDVETGEPITSDFLAIGASAATLGVSSSPELLFAFDASSDSRLLATTGNGDVAIHDRRSAESFSIDLELATRSPSTPDRVFFIDKVQP